MQNLHFEIATEANLLPLLDLMQPFNDFEQVPWDRNATERALQTLLADRSLGVAVLLLRADALVGYFVLTWGYDLEWNGRDAFLTELFVTPSARGSGLGS